MAVRFCKNGISKLSPLKCVSEENEAVSFANSDNNAGSSVSDSASHWIIVMVSLSLFLYAAPIR